MPLPQGDHCGQLESLCLLDRYMPETSFLNFIRKCTNLTSLSLPYYLSLESLTNLVSARPELTFLRIDDLRGSAPNLNPHISIILSGLPNLLELSLSSGVIEDNVPMDILTHGLKKLHLSLCKLGAEGLMHLLGKCPGQHDTISDILFKKKSKKQSPIGKIIIRL